MKALLLIGAILGALALAGTAAAADNGATVTNDSWCTSASPFVTVCQDAKFVLKVETTPSGNVVRHERHNSVNGVDPSLRLHHR